MRQLMRTMLDGSVVVVAESEPFVVLGSCWNLWRLMLMMLSDSAFLIVSERNMRQLMRTMLDGSVALVVESAAADARAHAGTRGA